MALATKPPDDQGFTFYQNNWQEDQLKKLSRKLKTERPAPKLDRDVRGVPGHHRMGTEVELLMKRLSRNDHMKMQTLKPTATSDLNCDHTACICLILL